MGKKVTILVPLLTISIIICISLFYGYAKKAYEPIKTLPLLIVSFDNTSTTITPGSADFKLDQDNGNKEAVLMSIHSLPLGLKNDVIIVKPNSKLKIKTSYRADKMSYCIWNESIKYKTIKKNTLVVPEKPDTYIYQIECNWKQGCIIYGFRVKVE